MGGGGYFLSLYILISWLFWMGSHWQHWTAKSCLSAVAVSNGGDNHQFICTGISLYIPISWPFQMGSHWWHWTAKSWLSALAVSKGGGGIIISFTWVNLKNWAHLLHRRSFHITSKRPKNIYGIPLHVAVKLICLRIGLWICLSKDNVLLLLQ